MKKKKIEKSRLPLEELLTHRRKFTVSLQHIAYQNQQLEGDKKALKVDQKWLDEHEAEIADDFQLQGMQHLPKIQNSALIRFRNCWVQINPWLQENKQLQEILNRYWVFQFFSGIDNEAYKRLFSVFPPKTEVQNPLKKGGKFADCFSREFTSSDDSVPEEIYVPSVEQSNLIKKCITYLIFYWQYTVKEKEGQLTFELNRLQRLIDEKQSRGQLFRWLDAYLVENVSLDGTPGLLNHWYSRLRGFPPFAKAIDDEDTDPYLD